MKTTSVVAALAFILSACSSGDALRSPPGDGVEAPRGGARIEAVVAVASDGAEQLLTFRDRDLDVDCRFTRAADGRSRCLPGGPEVATASDAYFSDAGCTAPAADLARLASQACATARFALGSAGCAPRVYRVHERLSQVYMDRGAGCVPGPASPSAISDGFYRVEELAPAVFAAASVERGPVREGVAPLTLVAEDGARAPAGFEAAARGFACEIGQTREGLRCLPVARRLVGYVYTDADCHTPAAMADVCDRELLGEQRFAFDYATGDGGAIFELFESGEWLAEVYVGQRGSCTQEVGRTDGFRQGAPIPASNFPSGARETVTGPSGLAQRLERAGGWSRLGALTAGGSDCFFAETADGVLRCLPPAAAADLLYANARCSEPVGYGEVPALTRVESTCPTRGRPLVRTGEHVGAVYQLRSGACMHIADAKAGSKVQYSRYADAPPSDFVALDRVRR